MSQAIPSAHAYPSDVSRLGQTLAHWASATWRRLEREMAVRRDLAALGAMDDAGLADIGLARGGLDDVVRHGRSHRDCHQGSLGGSLGRRPAAGRATRRFGAAAPLSAAVATEWR